MATDSESFRPPTQSSTETLTTCGVLLLIVGGLAWAYLNVKEPTLTRQDPTRTELVETQQSPSKSNAPPARQELTPAGMVEQQNVADRPEGVPHVRLSDTSDAAGFLHGTVHNDTGRPIERLRLRVTTARWSDRGFDVKVKVEHNATAPFSFFIGESNTRVESFRVIGPNG
jgi:hypothetical protein